MHPEFGLGSERTRIVDGLGLMVGMIIGAGMFALPYAVSQAGVLWGGVNMGIALIVLTLIHLLYGEVVYVVRERHRLPGYSRMILGHRAGQAATFSLFFGAFGALLAYGILAGSFIHTLLPSIHAEVGTIAFLLAIPFVLRMETGQVGKFSFIVLSIFIATILSMAAIASSSFSLDNFAFANHANWFLPFGVFFFAFGGASIVPEIAEMFHKRKGRIFEGVLIGGTMIPALLYVIFIAMVVGVTGVATTTDAVTGLGGVLGGTIATLGAILGLIAVATSFVSFGLDSMNTLRVDYGYGKNRAWTLILLLPVMLFLFGARDFITVIGIIGTIAVGIDGILILLLARAVRHTHEHPKGFFPIGNIIPVILMAIFGAGITWELWSSLVLK